MRTTYASLVCLLLVACGGGESLSVPSSIEARIDPARLWYRTGQDVILTGLVSDQYGEVLADVEVRWTLDPAPAASAGTPESDPRRARFTLEAPGSAIFTGCVVPSDVDLEPTLCDSIAVRIDDGSPSLELETPMPGAELDDAAGIVVRGSVADRSVVRVYVNGTGADVDDVGRFETIAPAEFGVNHLLVDASDGLTDASQVEMDVLWAPAFTSALAADGRPELTLDDGIALWLGQGFFDDGEPLDPSITPIETRDLADLLDLVVTHLDVSSLVPDPVIDSPPTFTLRVLDVRLDEVQTELDLTADGADLFLRIGRVEAQTSGGLIIEGTSLPLTGTIRASAVAYAHLTIRKESEAAELEVSVGALTVGIESLEGTFVSEETAAVFLLAEGLFRRTLEDTLADAVRGTVESSVPAVLRDALTAVDSALASQSFSLDSAPFPPITIRVDGRIRSLSTSFRREMLATLRTTIGTDSASVHAGSRGVARLDLSPTAPAFFRDGSVAVGVRMSVLNGLLHALWSSGLLDVDVSPLLPSAVSGLVSEARLVGRLPPVLRPPRAGETDDLVLSVGQLELDLMFQGAPARFAVTLDAGVNIEVSDNRIALQITDTPALRVWTIVAASNPRLLSADAIRAILVELWPDLSASVADGLAFELPLPALGDLGGLTPELAGLALTLQATDRVRTRGDVLVLDADLVGALP